MLTLLLCMTIFSAKWTVAVYLDADNNLEAAGFDDFLEMAQVGSDSDINIVVQLDAYSTSNSYGWSTCKRFLVGNGIPPTAANAIMDIGEPNMGNPDTLIDFGKWVYDNYPADHYLLIIWNHGDGWRTVNLDGRGACTDDHGTADPDDPIDPFYLNFTNGEIQDATAQITAYCGRKWDIIGYDVCLNQMWENNVASVADFDYFVASEMSEWNDGWTYDHFLQALQDSNGNLTPVEFSDALVASYAFGEGGSTGDTQSSIDLAFVPALSTAINSFAKELMCARGSYSTQIDTARTNCYELDSSYPYYNQIDLYDYCLKLEAQSVPASVISSSQAVRTAITNAVTSNFAKAGNDCYGVGIYYQRPSSSYESIYDGTSIADTFWDNFLKGEACPVPLNISYLSNVIDDSAGNNNSIIDPGETIDMNITLTNSGMDTATGVNATLTTTDSYTTITQNYSTYPDIVSESNAISNSSYTFSVQNNCPVGHQIEFVLNISADTGYSNTSAFSISVGKFIGDSTDTPIAITDINTIVSTINVPSFCDITDVIVSVDITHSYKGDLIVKLVSPAGPAVYLHNRTGSSTDDIVTTYDSITAPDGPGIMDDFNGEKSWGDWELHVYDAANGDEGTLNSWTLSLDLNNCSEPYPIIVYNSHSIDDNAGGNNNQVAQPGESIIMPVILENEGYANATGVNATLSTIDPYVTITQNYSTYPNIPVGNTGLSNTSYAFSIDSGCPIGHEIIFTLDINADSSYTNQVNFSVMVSEFIISSTDTPIDLLRFDNDKIGITSIIDVPYSCNIVDILASVDITFGYIGDLIVDLTSPTGTTVRLHNLTGSFTDDIITTYDSLTVPDGPGTMTNFDGENSLGKWKLWVLIDDPGNLLYGTLNSWSLTLYLDNCTQPPPDMIFDSYSIDDNAGGNNNGVVESGEEIDMPITLTNIGYGDANNLSAILSTGCTYITVTANNANYPVLSYNASGESLTPYTFDVYNGLPMDYDVIFDLNITSDEGNWSDTFMITVNPSGTGCNWTFSTDTPIDIPDNVPAGVTSTITISEHKQIIDINCFVDITHAYIGDVIVELTSPTGTKVRLHDRSGGSADDIYTIYDSSSVPDGPGAMDDFLGEDAYGDWKLFASDNDAAITGQFNEWRLEICSDSQSDIDIDLTSGGEGLFFPEWSWANSPRQIAYIHTDSSGISNIRIANADGTGSPAAITTEADHVSHISQISWSPDDEYIIFASTAIYEKLHLRKIASDGTQAGNSDVVQPVGSLPSPYLKWVDPHWSNELNQSGNVQRVAASISGDIWVYEPNNTADPNSGIIRITDLSDPYLDMTATDKLYQPHWNQANTQIVFARRPASPIAAAADSNIFKCIEVQDIIQGISNPIGDPDGDGNGGDWGDTRLIQISSSTHPEYSPSFSINGNNVGYICDVADSFNNYDFWTDPIGSLSSTNFDAYSDNSPISGYENAQNEGFMKWSTGGGDSFTYIKEQAGIHSLQVVYDETIGGFMKGNSFIQDDKLIIEDNAYTRLSVPLEVALNYAYFGVTSLSHIPSNDPRIVPIGEFRKITADGIMEKGIFTKNAELRIFFTQEELMGRPVEWLELRKFSNGRWVLINSSVSDDADGNPENDLYDGGYVTAFIDSTAIYGLFINSPQKVSFDYKLDNARVYPNPWNASSSALDHLRIDHFGDNSSLEEVSIYNVCGELIATLNNAVTTENDGLDFLKWSVVNDDGKKVAPGIYIIYIRDNSGAKSTKKVAVIR